MQRGLLPFEVPWSPISIFLSRNVFFGPRAASVPSPDCRSLCCTLRRQSGDKETLAESKATAAYVFQMPTGARGKGGRHLRGAAVGGGEWSMVARGGELGKRNRQGGPVPYCQSQVFRFAGSRIVTGLGASGCGLRRCRCSCKQSSRRVMRV